MKAEDLTFNMISISHRKFHVYNHDNGDENKVTTYLCTKVNLSYCERLYLALD